MAEDVPRGDARSPARGWATLAGGVEPRRSEQSGGPSEKLERTTGKEPLGRASEQKVEGRAKLVRRKSPERRETIVPLLSELAAVTNAASMAYRVFPGVFVGQNRYVDRNGIPSLLREAARTRLPAERARP
ncbi:hypothetical protein KM043_012141 [Ampulex compressa]|nr:hypothetical protein KM043_012141 [Ampulex compressa]